MSIKHQRLVRSRFAVLFLPIVLLAVASAPPLLAQTQTRARESLLAIQRQVEAIQPRLIKSTVALMVAGASGSGVVISSDGYVLTAAHVISGPQRRRCSVVLSDGRRMPADVLGANRQGDFGIVKIRSASGLTAAPLGDSSVLHRGEWVLATGHPLGPHSDRPPVLRIGRILMLPGGRRGREPRRIITDAPIISGDSGGPLFDLNGRVVGIHSMITEGRQFASIHVPVNQPKAMLDQLERGENPESPDSRYAEYAAALRDADLQLSSGDPAAAVRSAARASELDPTSARACVVLARASAEAGDHAGAESAIAHACERGYSDVESLRNDPDLSSVVRDAALTPMLAKLDALESAPGSTKGDSSLLAAAGSGERDLGQGVVRILSGGTQVALGTAMSADGDILTKASELPSGPLTCALPDGTAFPLDRRNVDASWDVALLHARGAKLTVLPTAVTESVGSWVVAPDSSGTVEAIGVVGVASMPVRGRGISPKPTSKAYMGVQLEPVDREALRSLDVDHGVRVVVEPDLPAARAGMKSGDVIYEVDGREVADPDSLMDLMIGKKPGDSVSIRVARAQEKLSLTVNLTSRPADLPGRGGLPEMLSGDVSHMQGPFERVLHHDTVLPPNSMGGPLLDLEGRCAGLNIARADRSSTYAIAAADLKSIYAALKSR